MAEAGLFIPLPSPEGGRGLVQPSPGGPLLVPTALCPDPLRPGLILPPLARPTALLCPMWTLFILPPPLCTESLPAPITQSEHTNYFLPACCGNQHASRRFTHSKNILNLNYVTGLVPQAGIFSEEEQTPSLLRGLQSGGRDHQIPEAGVKCQL